MPLALRKTAKSKNWYLRGTVRGTPVDESTGTDDKELAEAIRIKRESELLQRSVFGTSKTVPFEKACESYLAAGGEAQYLGCEREDGSWTLLIGHFWNVNVRDIGQTEFDLAAKKLYPNASAATRIRQCYGPLKAVLRNASKHKWCERPDIEAPKTKPVVTKFSSPERLEKLLPHCSPRMRRFLMVEVYTGARLSEILRINWDNDVFLAERKIILWKTKTTQRAVYIPDPLLVELATVPDGERHGPMFRWTNKCSVLRPLKSACKRAGVEYLPPHQQGRHTYATWMMEYGGASLKEVMEAGNWKSVQSVIRYLHTSPGKAAKLADKLPGIGENPGSVTGMNAPKDLIQKRKLWPRR